MGIIDNLVACDVLGDYEVLVFFLVREFLGTPHKNWRGEDIPKELL